MDKNNALRVKIPEGKYVVAVSGGVDSMVLLRLLKEQADLELVVAHVDHGIREGSADDARFVEDSAWLYQLPFRLHTVRLGRGASEESARRERYAFLRRVVTEENAKALITAHHADDVVETVVLNLVRGTGWRGLCSLRSADVTLRPLLAYTKQELYDYALHHRLEWCEDETNFTNIYTRNYIRHQVIPACQKQDPHFKDTMRSLSRAQATLRASIEHELATLMQSVEQGGALKKKALLQLDAPLALEVLRSFLHAHSVRQTRPQLQRLLAFSISTGVKKRASLDGVHFLEVWQNELVVVTSQR